tara:strand:+ start:2747 stop:3538 length:792 start_codon:yes stop_codon:yes gene_type:complete
MSSVITSPNTRENPGYSDVVVLDVEKFPIVDTWGTLLGGNMGLEYYVLDEELWQYIPSHITHLRFPYKTADLGSRYWGEIRFKRSEYGVNDEGTTQKDKVPIDQTIFQEHVLPFMKGVITLKTQEIFEKRYNTLKTKYSHLEQAVFNDQLEESKAFLADNKAEIKLIDRLAKLRGLTTEEFATKIVESNVNWKEKLYDLAVAEQTVIRAVKDCESVAQVNVFLEDYYGEQMGLEQCLELGRCKKHDEEGIIQRIEEFKYGIKF